MRWVLSIVLLILTSCTSAPRPIPKWLRHVGMPKVDRAATLDTYESILIGEIDAGVYHPSRDTSPEQIAVLALGELQLSHPWDAAVLLALASQRRCEQAWAVLVYGSDQGWETAKAQTDGAIERDDYDAYLKAEIVTLRTATFDDELSRIAAKVGAPITAREVNDDLSRLVTGHVGDSDRHWEALRERAITLRTPIPERVSHPKLAEAVRRYLLLSVSAHFRSRQEHLLAETAAQYLALTPLASFRSASLDSAASSFDSNIVAAGMQLYAQTPEKVIEALGSESYATRSHAAVILGLVADPAHLATLRAAWEADRDRRAKLSLAFALMSLGDLTHGNEFKRELLSGDRYVSQLAATLITWLKPAALDFARDALIAKALEQENITGQTCFLLIHFLHARARDRPISDEALQAVLRAAYAVREHPYALDYISPLIGELDQLGRARVRQAIATRQEPLAPWVARFVHVATVDDLPQIEAWLDDSQYAGEHPMLVQAVAAIPGERAQAMLEKWLVDYPKLGVAVGMSLLRRKESSKQRLTRVLSESDLPAGSIFLELALGHPRASEHVVRLLRSRELGERMTAMVALQLFGTQRDVDAVWENVDYRDSRYYPRDVRLRYLSLSALIHVELNRTDGVRAAPTW